MICDFCGAPTTDSNERTYRSKPQVALLEKGQTYIDDGEYLACEACQALIKGKDSGRLMVRMIVFILKHNPQAKNPIATAESIMKHVLRDDLGL